MMSGTPTYANVVLLALPLLLFMVYVSSYELNLSTANAADSNGSYIKTGPAPNVINTFKRLVAEESRRNGRRHVNRGPRIQVQIGNRKYIRETILSFEQIPLEMVYDRDGNLFFTKVDLNADIPLSTALMRNGTARYKKVKGLRNGQGTAVDADGTVYFATNDGVFFYDKLEAVAKYYALKGEDVFEIFIDKNGNKYVISATAYAVHLLKPDLTKLPYSRVPVADSISVDSFNTAYYLHHGFVYMLGNGSTHPERIKELYKDSLSQIAYDSEDNVYIAYGGGLLFAPAGTGNFTRVRKIYGGPTAIAFDRHDNFALGYRKKIFRFNLMNAEPADSQG